MAGGKEKQLIVITYYGGKGRMYQDVIDRLDYDNTRVYIEPFGGGASVLLNKPRHDIEVYNEMNFGVYTLFKVLSDYDKGLELRERLKQVEYSRDCYYEALAYKNSLEEKDFKRENKRKLVQFVLDIEKEHNIKLFTDYKKYYRENKKADKVIEKVLQNIPLTAEEVKQRKKLLREYRRTVNGTFQVQTNYDEVDVAMATFIVHNMSLNGLTKNFDDTDSKEERFFSKVDDLVDVIERMQGVVVLNRDARALLERDCLNEILLENDVDIERIADCELMYYLDPPYLEDVNVTKEKIESGRESGIPGLVYKNGGFDELSHKLLLCQMRNCEANILVSNYRDFFCIYDTYLHEATGWRYTEYEAITNLNGKCNDRTEILWQNY